MKFHGVDIAEGDNLIQQQQLDKSKNAFFGIGSEKVDYTQE